MINSWPIHGDSCEKQKSTCLDFSFHLLHVCHKSRIFAKKWNSMTTINITPTSLDALWALFKNQPQSIRHAFTRRLLKDHSEIEEAIQSNISEQQAKALKRLKELELLPDNWDEEGAVKIDSDVINHAVDIVYACNDQVLSSWNIFPEANGTLLFQKSDNSAVASIGKKTTPFTAIEK